MRQHHFYDDLHLTVPDGVYTPQEDTDLAADWVTDNVTADDRVADIGTGSGMLAIVAARQGAEVHATDINPLAVETARSNAEEAGVKIAVHDGSLFGPLEGRFAVVLFNAPYLPGDREDRTDEELAWYGGRTGREIIEEFLDVLDTHLEDDGTALIVVSSLTDIDATEQLIQDHGYESERAGSEKVSWERIQLLTASKF